ncbi:hypothetical protein, partial [Ferruginibacter sp.]
SSRTHVEVRTARPHPRSDGRRRRGDGGRARRTRCCSASTPTRLAGASPMFLGISFVPFLFVAPLIGLAIDRMAGGRRLVIQIITVVRVVLSVLMAFNVDSLLLFPLAFVAMVGAEDLRDLEERDRADRRAHRGRARRGRTRSSV